MRTHRHLTRFKNAFERLEAEERDKEIHNVKVVDSELKRIMTDKDKPIKSFIKGEAEASRRKPINTHVLLKGFI